jgi:2-polyprenyl-6-methoxyphenol hydroxylase-like FAD-dependent oxidoreductase
MLRGSVRQVAAAHIEGEGAELQDFAGIRPVFNHARNLSVDSWHHYNAFKRCELESGGLSGVSSEIIIVGAGLAGAALAAVLGQQGRRVILVDPHSSYPQVFKAEKLAREQVLLLRKLGLLEYLLPYSGRWSEVQVGYDGRIFKTSRGEQYGINYADMVNALRAIVPPVVDHRCERVELVANSSHLQRVKLARGEELTSRLVVLASGASSGLEANLRLRRRLVQRDQSLVLGFNMAAFEARPFDFDSVTYHSVSPSTRIGYLTLFKIRKTMRANLFIFRSAYDPWVREFILEPERMLRHHLPKLSEVIGEYRVISKVESGRVDLYSVDGNPRPGVVLIGDAFQSVCPSTGLGLDKVLTDVDVLSRCVPHWFETPGMGVDKLVDFYNHPRKLAADSRALQRAHNQRCAAVDSSLRWQIHRFLLHLKWQFLGGIEGLRRRGRREAGKVAFSSVFNTRK